MTYIQFLKIISLIKVKTMKIGERFAKIKFGFLTCCSIEVNEIFQKLFILLQNINPSYSNQLEESSDHVVCNSIALADTMIQFNCNFLRTAKNGRGRTRPIFLKLCYRYKLVPAPLFRLYF